MHRLMSTIWGKILIGLVGLLVVCCVFGAIVGPRNQQTGASSAASAPTAAPAAPTTPNATTAPAPTAPPLPTKEPEPTAVPTEAPTEVANGLGADDRAYIQSVAASVTTFGKELGAISALAQTYQPGTVWLATFNNHLDAMRTAQADLLKLTPPARFADEHTQLISSTNTCVEAVTTFEQGAQAQNVDKIQTAVVKMKDCSSGIQTTQAAFEHEIAQ